MRDGSQTRARLERCALTLFVKKGVHATTIKDIANKAGIAEGTLYRHYQSKEELAQTLFSRSYEEMTVKMREIAELFPSLAEKISAMVHFFCEKYDQDSILFNYLLLVQHTQIKAMPENNSHEMLVALLNEAIRKKELVRKDPHFYAAIIMGIVLQAAISRVHGRITRSMSADAEDLSKAIIGALNI